MERKEVYRFILAAFRNNAQAEVFLRAQPEYGDRLANAIPNPRVNREEFAFEMADRLARWGYAEQFIAAAKAAGHDVGQIRTVPSALAAAIQRDGILNLPVDAWDQALRWILRVANRTHRVEEVDALLMLPRTDEVRDRIAELLKPYDEDVDTSEPPKIGVYWAGDGRSLVIYWEGTFTPGRYAQATFGPPVVLDHVTSPGAVTIAWCEGARGSSARGKGWSHWLDVPRAFGVLLAQAIVVA